MGKNIRYTLWLRYTAPAVVPGVAYQVPAKLVLEVIRWHQGKGIAQFEGVLDRNTAEALRGVLLQVDSSEIAEPDDPDEFNDHQLAGLSVVSVDGDVVELAEWCGVPDSAGLFPGPAGWRQGLHR